MPFSCRNIHIGYPHTKWQLLFDSTKIYFFSCYEKRLHSPFLPLHRQNKEVWVSGLKQHTANVPNRKVPKVRNRLQRAQKPSLLGLCRVSGDSHGNPLASANLSYGIMVAQLVLVLLAKVRFLLGRQVKKQLHGVIGSIPDFRSGGGGSKSP